jgi:hypothetical protein
MALINETRKQVLQELLWVFFIIIICIADSMG